jgi:primosomal replication protein N
MVDHDARRQLANSLKLLIDGKITTDAFYRLRLGSKVTVHGSNSMKSRGFCKAEGRFEPQNAHLRSRTP